jgi:hypothetical protein
MLSGIERESATELTSIHELRFKLLKDEISAQGNTFDQIDMKTGVALGFTFVVVGQVLASVFRVATDQSHYESSYPLLTNSLFVFANGLAFLAILCGIAARWPRSFQHSVAFDQKELTGSYQSLIETTLKDLGEITIANEATNKSKGWWASWTYSFVAAALSCYLALTVLLYFSSALKH